MACDKLKTDVNLIIDSMGIVLYSKDMVFIKEMQEGRNFFDEEYKDKKQAVSHIKKGDVVGFCTGTSGNFKLKFRYGEPEKEKKDNFPVSIELGIVVKGKKISVVDLFWLMEWEDESCLDCPKEQQIEVEDGIYKLTVLTAKPKSGVWGEEQIIYIYMKQQEKIPILTYNDVPLLYAEEV